MRLCNPRGCGFPRGEAEGENYKRVGLLGAYTTPFHGCNQLILYYACANSNHKSVGYVKN